MTSAPCWRLPTGQRLLFEDFDDGIVMFDAAVGATHLLNPTAAEALAIVQEHPGLSTAELHAQLLRRLEIAADVLPAAALAELMRRLEDLQLVSAVPA
jgi:PqqD family protein of HPr-rel-A system